MDPLIAETAQRMVADCKGNPDALWSALSDSGLSAGWALSAEGEQPLSVADGFGLVRIVATAATSVPLAETLTASYLLAAAGVSAPAGKGAVLLDANQPVADGHYSGCLAAVDFGAELDWLLCVQANNGGQLMLLPAPQACSPIDSPHDDPAADLHYSHCQPTCVVDAPSWLDGHRFQLFMALMASARLCGAMESALALTLAYAAQREQFGRSLSKFQAIQHMLSEMAGETSASIAAFDAALDDIDHSGPLLLSAAAAKIRASEAAGVVVAHAHQVHGAIGYTEAYELAGLTRRLIRWRDDCGDETFWSVAVGRAITAPDSPTIKERVFGQTS